MEAKQISWRALKDASICKTCAGSLRHIPRNWKGNASIGCASTAMTHVLFVMRFGVAFYLSNARSHITAGWLLDLTSLRKRHTLFRAHVTDAKVLAIVPYPQL